MHRFSRSSIRIRLTLWYSVILGTIVTAFALGSFLVIRVVLERRTDRFLRDAVDTFADEVRREALRTSDLRKVVRDELIDYRFREIDFITLEGDRIVGRSPPLQSSRNVAAEPTVPLNERALVTAVRARRTPGIFTLEDEEGGFRAANRVVTVGETTVGVVAVQSLHGHAETLELIALGYWIAVPILILLSTGGGYWLAARGLAPVSAMSRKAASIGSDNLDERLRAPNEHDEIGELANVFNGLLDRVESAFTQQREFMQDASHELRSPVAAVRMESEVALRVEHRPESAYREALETIRRSSLRLSKIVDDLFFLTRADASEHRAGSELLDLGEVAYSAVRTLRPVAAARSVRIELADPPEAPIRGDASDLERIVVNLVENAIKYSEAGGVVRVGVVAEGGQWFALRVVDHGPGVAEEIRDRIFERFVRGGRIDDGEHEGAGLGLAIARALAERYGGRLELEATGSEGSTFVWHVRHAMTP